MFHIVTVALNVFQLYFKRHASKAENQYRHNLKMHFETEKKKFCRRSKSVILQEI